MRGLFLSEGRGGGETGKGEKAKGREVEMTWRKGFGPPKNFGVAPLTPAASWYGEGNGREGRGTERENRGRKQENGKEGKLEQGRRLAQAGPVQLMQLQKWKLPTADG